MGNQPLEQNCDILPPKTWMESQNLNTLFDILLWYENSG
jgi:hypothetical protein